MKFFDLLTTKAFLAEIGEFNLIAEVDSNFVPTSEQVDTFLSNRTPLVKKLKDSRKSQTQKTNWRKNRHKMMKGIKKFHRSVDGKRFHRKLGNYIATRITKGDASKNENGYEVLMAKQDFLKGLNSAKQHLFVELDYYHSLDEQVELEEMIIDYAIPLFQRIENKTVTNEELNDDDLTFLFDLTDKSAIIKCIAEKFEVEVAKADKLWNAISTKLYEDKIDELDCTFYPKLIVELRNKFKEEFVSEKNTKWH